MTLLLYSLGVVLNFVMWLTYSTLGNETRELFDLKEGESWKVGALGTVVGAGYMIAAAPASYTLAQRHGLRKGMLCSSACNVLAGILRYIGQVATIYVLVLCGQLLVGLAQPFVMAAAAQLSNECFGPTERGLATSIAILAQVIGQALVFLLGPAVGFYPLVLGELVACGLHLPLLWLWLLCGAKDHAAAPSTEASSPRSRPRGWASAARDATLPCNALWTHPAFVVLALSSGVCIGLFWSLALVFVELLGPLGYSETQAGYATFAFLLAGGVSLVGIGIVLDRTHAYRSATLGCIYVACVCSLALALVIEPGDVVSPGLLAACAVLGMALTALQAVALETAAEVTYPMPEATSSGVVLAIATGLYIGLPLLVEATKLSLKGLLFASAAVLGGIALLLSVTFRPHYRRREAEQDGGATASDSTTSNPIEIAITSR